LIAVLVGVVTYPSLTTAAVVPPPVINALGTDDCWVDQFFDKNTGNWNQYYTPGTTSANAQTGVEAQRKLFGINQPYTFDVSPDGGFIFIHDPKKKDLVWRLHKIPCPPPYQAPIYLTEFNAAIFLIKTFGIGDTTEKTPAGVVTNHFLDNQDPLGVGVALSYGFTPWANNWVVSPYIAFDYLNTPVYHTFANGSFLGTKANYALSGGAKIGPTVSNDVWIYGIFGGALLNETQRISFATESSQTSMVAGVTLGLGAAYRPSFLQAFGRPVAVTLEYQHFWWRDAQFNAPAASPAFNYIFGREDDVVKLGLTISFASTPAAKPAYPVKAPALK
jgi:hypothetical protein